MSERGDSSCSSAGTYRLAPPEEVPADEERACRFQISPECNTMKKGCYVCKKCWKASDAKEKEQYKQWTEGKWIEGYCQKLGCWDFAARKQTLCPRHIKKGQCSGSGGHGHRGRSSGRSRNRPSVAFAPAPREPAMPPTMPAADGRLARTLRPAALHF